MTLQRLFFIPDTHRPYHDERAWQLVLKAARYFKPHKLIVLGDFADCYSISAHDKSPSRVESFEDEITDANTGLDEIEAATPIADRYFVAGNHEHRLERFLQTNAPPLYSMLTIPRLLRLRERGWYYTPYQHSLKIGKLYITHDEGNAGPQAHERARSSFGSNVVIGHCLPADYEVLTVNRGFVPLREMLCTDTVLAYKDGAVVTSPVRDVVHWRYSGDVACFDNTAIAQTMTDRHHIYTKDGRYVPVREAVETLSKNDLVMQAEPLDGDEYPISDDMLRFVVAYCADGHRASEGSIRFHLKKPRKIARLTEILTGLGASVAWSEPGRNGGVKTKALSRSVQLEVIRLAPDKTLPLWLLQLSPRQRRIVIDELELWDGTRIVHGETDYGCRQFGSSKQVERDLIQLLLMQQGIRSSVSGANVLYNVMPRSAGSLRKLKECVRWKAVADLEVGCITTDTQNFFVRTTEKRVELSGNTHRVSISYRGNAQGKSHVGAMFGWLGDIDRIDYIHRVKAQQWQHGFGIGYLRSNGIVHLEAVPIVEGACVVEGKLLRSAK